MEVNKGLLAFFAEEEVAVGVVVHKEVFGEDGGAVGMAEEVEGGFLVGVAVGVVGAEAHAGEVGLGGVVEGGGEGIGTGGSGSGVGAPAAGGEPAVAVAGGVAVDGDEDDVLAAQLSAPLVHAAAALGGLWEKTARLRVCTESSKHGRMFICFVTLILASYMRHIRDTEFE
jgi:hypothetical protein